MLDYEAYRRVVYASIDYQELQLCVAEIFSSPHNVLYGPDQRYRASLRDRYYHYYYRLLS
jgi:hypothetical protein